jgi:hypothetical protein
MDAEFLRSASGALVVLSVLLALVLTFVVRSVGTRLVAIILLGAAVFGLVHYRQTLEQCNNKTGCECRFLGQVVRGGSCSRDSAHNS